MENKENNSPELKKKSHWNIRPYLAIALTAFLVITLSIIFFFLIYRYLWAQAEKPIRFIGWIRN